MTEDRQTLGGSWRAVAWLLIATSLGGILGRILAVESRDGATPFLSANDRSRWCAIRSLVDHGTYAIDPVILREDGQFDKRWASIDMVRRRGPDGRQHYYSSKPPLLSTLLAGAYWLIKTSTGADLREEPFYIGRAILILANALPLLAMLVLVVHLADRLGKTDWGRLFVVTAAAFGTFLTTFAVTINNHLPAAVCALAALVAALPVWQNGDRKLWRFAVAGFFAALAAANELPALSFLVMLGAGLLWRSPWATALGYVPAAAVVAAAFFATNHLAHQSWRPPYMHRGDRATLLKFDSPELTEDIAAGVVPSMLASRLKAAGVELSNAAVIRPAVGEDRWEIWDPQSHYRYVLLASVDGIEVREWDNWYEYPGSYWTSGQKRGVDRGEPSRAVYAFHALAGHHGVFSLTPIWLLSVVGVGAMLYRGEDKLRGLGLMIATLTVVCLTFYIMRDLKDRNYGGVSCGFRWLFWLIPFWLVALFPVTDWLAGRRWGRAVAGILLLISVLSASYACMNPWTPPWLFDYWTYVGWIEYP